MNMKWEGLEQGAPMQVIALGILSHTRRATICRTTALLA